MTEINPNLRIAQQLEDYTISISPYDVKRPYIGLSQVVKSEEELISDYLKGREASRLERLKCYKGYQMERDLVQRIEKMYGSLVEHREIIAFEGFVKGHPDYWLDSYPGDCKSVLKDEWLPQHGKLPQRIYWQLQGYMHYSHTDLAICIFESRENGLIRDYWIKYNPAIASKIEAKLHRVVLHLQNQYNTHEQSN